jgi:transmembrane sensor
MMSHRIGFEDARMQRMEQATLWLQRMRTSDQDDRIVEDWLDWCQRDPLNQQAFDDIAAVWEISGKLQSVPVAAAVARQAPPVISRRALAASFAGVGLASIAGAWLWMKSGDKLLTAELASPVGVNSIRKLADGSVLELGGGTRVTVSIGARERRVALHEGEVFVTVHHDARRPFSVASGALEVVATGTAFNVLRTDARTTVTVTEGSVATFQEGRAAEANIRLQTGQQLIYSHATHSGAVREADTGHAIAWRTGMFYFQNEPLAEIVATINRYESRRIVLQQDPRITGFGFTGTLDIKRVDKWLEGIPNLFSFRVGVTDLADGRRLVASADARPD